MANYYYGLTFSSVDEKKAFVEKVYKKMEEEGLSVKDVADLIGYSKKSVYQFFSDNKIANKFLAAALKNKLNIE